MGCGQRYSLFPHLALGGFTEHTVSKSARICPKPILQSLTSCTYQVLHPLWLLISTKQPTHFRLSSTGSGAIQLCLGLQRPSSPDLPLYSAGDQVQDFVHAGRALCSWAPAQPLSLSEQTKESHWTYEPRFPCMIGPTTHFCKESVLSVSSR